MKTPSPDDFEVAWDLDNLGLKDYGEDKELELPMSVPEPPTIDTGPVAEGYSHIPTNSRVVVYDRKAYTREEATTRFNLMKEKHSWRVVEVFNTRRYWCWRIYT